jgi:integrase
VAVYQRGKNWYIDFTFHGERVREMIGPSKKGAQKVIDKRKGEIAENKFLDKRTDPEPLRFHDFAREYLKWGRANKKPSSYQGDIWRMRQLDKVFGDQDMREITAREIEKYKIKRTSEVRRTGVVMEPIEEGKIWRVKYYNPKKKKMAKTFTDCKEAEAYLERMKSPNCVGTCNRELALLKHMYTLAIEWGKVAENPARRVRLFKGEIERLRYLMPDEVQRLLKNCPDHLRAIVTVAVHTGMRRGELLRLRREQVNFDLGIIDLTDTKNRKPRHIPMSQTVKEVLQGIQGREEHFFISDRRLGQAIKDVYHSFTTAVRQSGIVDFHFHDLRHTFASNLVMQGVDILTVKELMGHKKIEMTLRYAHLAPSYKTRAIAILDQTFSLASSSPPDPEKSRGPVQSYAIPEINLSQIPPHSEGAFEESRVTH